MEVKVEFKSLVERIKMFGSKGGADNTQKTKTAKKIICEKLIEEIGEMKIYEYNLRKINRRNRRNENI